MQLINSIATLAVAVSSVNALGSAIINNNCDFNVYLWPVDATRNPGSPLTIASKGSYSEVYHTPASGGVSLKLSKTTSDSLITQLEYTVESYAGSNFVWYDGSNVDCTGSECPFWSNGMHLATSISSCPTRDCPVDEECTGFYTLYNDDVNSLSCDQSADTILTLCSVNTGSGSSGAYSAVSVAAPSSSAAKAYSTTSAAKASSSTKSPTVNEAVATTFVTKYASPSKRAAEPVHHNHMRIHQRGNQ